MKVTLLLPLMLFGVYALEAEFIVRDIDFSNFNGDGDNDYVNNFNSNDYSYSPTLTYGGSQGSILTPAYTSWANTLARYRYSANPTIGETMVFSVDFLYDSSLVNPNSNERPVGIFLEGNHGVKAYIETNGNLTISSYYWNNNNWYSGDPYETYGSTVNLSDDEWYRLTLTIDVIGGQFGDQTNITAEVHELNNFTSVGNAGGKLYDILFIENENISVGLHGSLWGGASRLDNFHFEASTNDQITDSHAQTNENTPVSLVNTVMVRYYDGDPPPNYGVEYSYYKTDTELIFLDEEEISVNIYNWNSIESRVTDQTFNEYFIYNYSDENSGTFVIDGLETGTFVFYDASLDLDSNGISDGEQIEAGNLLNINHKLIPNFTNLAPSNSDTDNDGVTDDSDAFPNDPSETTDTDGDGVGDNSDAFPNNPTETTDSDGDGVGDNSDLYPNYNDSVILNFISEYNSNHNYLQVDEIQDLRLGSTMIEVTGNQATVQLQMEESSDLESWTETGTPATMTIPADTDTKFFRFKMAE